MNRRPISAYAAAAAVGMGLALAGITAPRSAHAQYSCPPGYYYDLAYGCVPTVYLYGPPYYPYPDFGFDFFYGGGWGGGGRWHGGHGGGGWHGGGGSHGGGGHGGGGHR